MRADNADHLLLLRAKRLCNETCFTVALQHRRLGSAEPEDKVFVFRWWADLQFLVVALRRMRRSAQIAARVPGLTDSVKVAIQKFDATLPGILRMRNVGEHVDSYAANDASRHDKAVLAEHLEVGTWDGRIYEWLGESLNIDTALRAAESLLHAIKELHCPVSHK